MSKTLICDNCYEPVPCRCDNTVAVPRRELELYRRSMKRIGRLTTSDAMKQIAREVADRLSELLKEDE